mmetsp:Transcript_29951/g.80466  ORF Transcript_29951/g.80466 Transcript_29951/m.80466 type:complete len:238 (-) Transcript_29951:68-781(-)
MDARCLKRAIHSAFSLPGTAAAIWSHLSSAFFGTDLSADSRAACCSADHSPIFAAPPFTPATGADGPWACAGGGAAAGCVDGAELAASGLTSSHSSDAPDAACGCEAVTGGGAACCAEVAEPGVAEAPFALVATWCDVGAANVLRIPFTCSETCFSVRSPPPVPSLMKSATVAQRAGIPAGNLTMAFFSSRSSCSLHCRVFLAAGAEAAGVGVGAGGLPAPANSMCGLAASVMRAVT